MSFVWTSLVVLQWLFSTQLRLKWGPIWHGINFTGWRMMQLDGVSKSYDKIYFQVSIIIRESWYRSHCKIHTDLIFFNAEAFAVFASLFATLVMVSLRLFALSSPFTFREWAKLRYIAIMNILSWVAGTFLIHES